TFSEAVAAGSPTCSPQLVRTWTATDGCGNSAQRSQTITVSGGSLTLTCPPDATAACGQTPDPALTGTPTATSTCGTVTVAYSDARAGQGAILRPGTATNGCSTQTCVQQITLTTGTSCIDSDFNNTAISTGRTIWFSAVVKPPSNNSPGTIYLSNSTIHFT